MRTKINKSQYTPMHSKYPFCSVSSGLVSLIGVMAEAV